MSEKENKFIHGDFADGYRRNTDAEKTQPFALSSQTQKIPSKSEKTAPVRPSEREYVQPGKKTASKPAAKKTTGSAVRKPAATAQGRRQSTAPSARTRAAQTAPKKRAAASDRPERQLSANEKRQRHNELRRKKKQRRQLITYVFVSIVVLALAVVLSLTVFFQINEITVKGNSPYTQQEIIGASGIAMGENIIMCDAEGVSDKLSKALPYISGATVERSASGKVVITVETTAPRWSFLGETDAVLIDSTGKVLERTSPERALEATIIQGAQIVSATPGEVIVLGEETPLNMIFTIGRAFDSKGLDELTMLNISDVDYIQGLYDSRLTLIIGSMENITDKIALTAGVIERENEINPTQYGTIDLTIDDKAYFRPSEENPDAYDESVDEAADTQQEESDGDEGDGEPQA